MRRCQGYLVMFKKSCLWNIKRAGTKSKGNYASPTSGEAYRDLQPTTNFEFWVDFFLCADMFPYEYSKTVSVCPYPEKRNHHSFVNISPILVIDTSMEWSSRVLQHGNPKMWKNFKKFEIDEIEYCPYPEFLYAEKKKIALASSISVLHK